MQLCVTSQTQVSTSLPCKRWKCSVTDIPADGAVQIIILGQIEIVHMTAPKNQHLNYKAIPIKGCFWLLALQSGLKSRRSGMVNIFMRCFYAHIHFFTLITLTVCKLWHVCKLVYICASLDSVCSKQFSVCVPSPPGKGSSCTQCRAGPSRGVPRAAEECVVGRMCMRDRNSEGS